MSHMVKLFLIVDPRRTNHIEQYVWQESTSSVFQVISAPKLQASPQKN